MPKKKSQKTVKAKQPPIAEVRQLEAQKKPEGPGAGEERGSTRPAAR